jgi:hypothetical protein
MSAPSTEIADVQHNELTEKQNRILKYLQKHATEQTYFKSRLIGEELGLSSKEVGTNMPAVQPCVLV